MWLLILEAVMAMSLLVFIVWWTMFHGREARPPQSKKRSSDHDTNQHPPQ